MKNGAFGLIALLLPLAAALAAENTDKPYVWKKIDKKDIAIEELAHSYFFHAGASAEQLRLVISQDGINKLQPAIGEHTQEMKDIKKIAEKMRRLCTSLQDAKTGQDFATALIEMEEREHEEGRHSARHILSKLDVGDRQSLERYLDVEYRKAVTRSTIDWQTMLASGPFPSELTNSVKGRLCKKAAEAEGATS